MTLSCSARTALSHDQACGDYVKTEWHECLDAAADEQHMY